MCTAPLPTVPVLVVATRCQNWGVIPTPTLSYLLRDTYPPTSGYLPPEKDQWPEIPTPPEGTWLKRYLSPPRDLGIEIATPSPFRGQKTLVAGGKNKIKQIYPKVAYRKRESKSQKLNVSVFIRNILCIRLTNCHKNKVLNKYIWMMFCLLHNLFHTYQLYFAK